MTASLVVAKVKETLLPPVRMVGPTVKRWSGYVLIGVGGWFIVLATLRSPIIGA
ncbi:MAG: hypothetical protein U9N84_12420 [Actinomycetota bacterium]|nr:hypothetical protein [Actinomycetota bacterium]